MENTMHQRLRGGVTIITAKARRQGGQVSFWRRRRWWLVSGVGALIVFLATVGFLSSQPVYVTAPEVPKIMAAQEGLKFGILIPTYMPKGFDRETVDLKVDQYSGPSGAPQASLIYRNLRKAAAIFINQWVPSDPEHETLVGSRPIVTRWGKGLLLSERGGTGMGNLWVDIGQLRVSVSSSSLNVASAEQLLQIANTLGLASEDQVYTFKTEPISIYAVAPPPPFEVLLNSAGVQELNLTITPGGYSPIRFVVKRGAPVKVNFRLLGEVGCGNVGVIDMGKNGTIGLVVSKDRPLSVVEFTPEETGDFQIYCTHYTYRGIMTVRE